MSSPHQSPGGSNAASHGWLYWLVFPGGAERIEPALDAVVLPAVRHAQASAELDRWFFIRYVEERGHHLRLRIAGAPDELARAQPELDAMIGKALEDVAALPPRPVSSLVSFAATPPAAADHVGVYHAIYEPEEDKYGGPAGVPIAEAMFEVSSELTVGLLDGLEDVLDRAALALALMKETGRLGVAAERRSRFWSDYAAFWSGSRGNGASTLLEEEAERVGEELLARTERLRGDARSWPWVERYGESLSGMLGQAAARAIKTPAQLCLHHAHMTNNRLGVSPLEEALLATLLARAIPVAAGGGAVEAPGRRRVAPREEPSREAGRVRDEADVEREPEAQPHPAPSPAPEADDSAHPSPPRVQAGGPAVEIEGVEKSYGDRQAVRGISLTIQRGEVFGLLGPNGAGKTTTLEMAVGLRQPDAGRVRVLGLDPRRQREQLLQKVAVQPQHASLFPNARVGEILSLWASFYDNGSRADDVLRLVGLEDKVRDQVRNLSGGQRQRLLLGVALTSNPEILFLDEPTEGLDPNARQQLWELIAAQRAQGRTVVLTTHAMPEAEELCDRVAIVMQGKVVASGRPHDLIRQTFPRQTIFFRTATEPERSVLEGVRGARGSRVEPDGDAFSVRIETDQPEELLKAIADEPALPPVRDLRIEQHDLHDVFVKITNSSIEIDGSISRDHATEAV